MKRKTTNKENIYESIYEPKKVKQMHTTNLYFDNKKYNPVDYTTFVAKMYLNTK